MSEQWRTDLERLRECYPTTAAGTALYLVSVLLDDEGVEKPRRRGAPGLLPQNVVRC
jgi:hypothetical protein